MSKLKTVYIFRHGETDWNREHRLQGHTDIELNELGLKQAERLREFFAKNPVDVFLASDLSRARETARIAAQDIGVEVIIDKRLRETHLGKAEGMTRDEIEEKLGAEVWQNWLQLGPDAQHHRFPGGESKAEHLARLLEALEAYLRKTPHERVGVATHGGAMRRLFHHFRPDLKDAVMVGNCVVYEFTFHPLTGEWTIDTEPKSPHFSD